MCDKNNSVGKILVPCYNGFSLLDNASDSDDALLGETEAKREPDKLQSMSRFWTNSNDDICNIKGFVANVHDATNYDIDLELSSEQRWRYNNVVSDHYTYHDLSPGFYLEDNFFQQTDVVPVVGITYRCRLRGVGTNRSVAGRDKRRNDSIVIAIKKLLDRTDCWVKCTLSNVDKYRRLLVDIVLYTPNSTINLKHFLLNYNEKKFGVLEPLFFAYPTRPC